MEIVATIIAALLAFCLPYGQWRQLRAIGSDHSVHLFLANSIRACNHRLPVRLPRLLINPDCNSCPLFPHWGLSFLSRRQVGLLTRLLNPSISAALIVLTSVVLKYQGASAVAIGWTCLLLALTPQYIHANSVRNYGLSARPIGLLLVVVAALLAFWAHAGPDSWLPFVAGVLIGYLIWGSSRFAQQAMLFIGVALGVAFGNWTMLGTVAASLGLFILLQRRYALHYLKHNFLFLRAYATKLARVFILKRRHSVWRDLVYDIWVRPFSSRQERVAYAYGNPVLILLFANPLTFIAVWMAWWGPPTEPIIAFSAQMAAASMLVFLLTSFRVTRFLGEPERYVELTTVFSTIAGVAHLLTTGRSGWLWVTTGYFVVGLIAQFAVGYRLKRQAPRTLVDTSAVEAIINSSFKGEAVRFASNNDQFTALLMANPWSYAKLWSCEQDYGGVSVGEAFQYYPYALSKPFEALLVQEKINVILLDKANFSEIFTENAVLREQLELLDDKATYRLYRLRWNT